MVPVATRTMSFAVESRTERTLPNGQEEAPSRASDAPRAREVVIAAVAFLALAVAVYGHHILNGGFLLDDWSNYVTVNLDDDGFWKDVSEFAEGQGSRPLTGAYYGVFMNLFGQHMGWWLAWIAGLGAAVSFGVYWVLRLLRMGVVDSAIVAGLLLVLPGSDTLRLWAVGGSQQVAIAWTAFGFVAALLAFRVERRLPRVALHALSVTLFAASLLFVEMTLPVMLLSGLVYLLVATKRAALTRWGVDVVVLGAIVVWGRGRSAMQAQPFDGMLDHAREIARQAWTFLATQVLPFTAASWLLALALLAVPIVAAAIALRAREHPERPAMLRWLGVLAAGALVMAASYAAYVPAENWYAPLQAGLGNRVNGVAAIGWLLMVVAWLRLLATLVVRPRLLPFAAPLLALLLGAIYVERTLDDARAYQQGFQIGRQTLDTIRGAVPEPPRGAMIYAFGQPLETKPGVPVFHATWDLNSAARVLYGDATVRALPAFPALRFTCERDRVVPDFGWDPATRERFASEYGRTFFVDTVAGRALPITSRKVCEKANAEWPRSPVYPPPPPPG